MMGYNAKDNTKSHGCTAHFHCGSSYISIVYNTMYNGNSTKRFTPLKMSTYISLVDSGPKVDPLNTLMDASVLCPRQFRLVN